MELSDIVLAFVSILSAITGGVVKSEYIDKLPNHYEFLKNKIYN